MHPDRLLSILTWAGIAGLLILNADGAVKVINAIGGFATSYVTTVQGRPAAAGG